LKNSVGKHFKIWPGKEGGRKEAYQAAHNRTTNPIFNLFAHAHVW
jgi:hypothetical protein